MLVKIDRLKYYWFVPLLVFSIPMGLDDNLLQPISLALLFPFIVLGLYKNPLVFLFPLYVICVSLINMVLGDKSSFFQLARSGVPFAFVLILIATNRSLAITWEQFSNQSNLVKLSRMVILALVLSQVTQIILLVLGLDIANATFITNGGRRVFLYPGSAMLLCFFYGLYCRNVIIFLGSSLILLSTGSKVVLGAMAVLYLFSSVTAKTISKRFLAVLSLIVFVALLVMLEVNAVQRLLGFATHEGLSDSTRAWQIAHAKIAWAENVFTMFFGKGVGVPLTPGWPTADPRWFYNSQYDIENLYWSLLPKFGIFGCAMLFFILGKLPWDVWTKAVLIILICYSFGTSYQFFTTLDGAMLLFCSIIVRSAVNSEVPRSFNSGLLRKLQMLYRK